MVAINNRRVRAGGLMRGLVGLIGDIFFYALMFLALLLMTINLKETFDSIYHSVDLTQIKSSLKSVVKTSPTSMTDAPVVPVNIESCTAAQLSTIQVQLPSKECLENKDQPYSYGGMCSFSYATRCPQPRWLHDYYKGLKATGQQRQAIYVGSSRGIDAINTMRMLSSNSTYDKAQWRQVVSQNIFALESCQSRVDPIYSIPAEAPISQVEMHLFDTTPEAVKELVRTHEALKFGSNLKIVHANVASSDGTVKASDGSDVKQYRLDTYAKANMDLTRPIDMMILNLGANDVLVLDAAVETLAKTNYFEMDYNWKDGWSQYSLSPIIARLKRNDFVCYWPGTGGNLWRITDCFQDYYNIKMWSRFACVKKSHAGLFNIMEDYFNKTLEAGARIQYKDRNTAETNGRGI
ncbi:hypothetical protein MPSEU_000914000 [Mayamaea pseudoterrestris]|nr:hypothetical protein MPSEU_000914000 [Mayamaea pseudoterrestris]